MLRRAILMIGRFALSAWVGAAALFVVNGVRQVTSGRFDSVTLNNLALVRFPPYYAFGFVFVTVGFLCVLAGGLAAMSRGRWLLVLSLLAAALFVMVYDYRAIYLPLEGMVTPPEAARPAEFVTLHAQSEIVNSIHVGLAFVAALIVNWPAVPESRRA